MRQLSERALCPQPRKPELASGRVPLNVRVTLRSWLKNKGMPNFDAQQWYRPTKAKLQLVKNRSNAADSPYMIGKKLWWYWSLVGGDLCRPSNVSRGIILRVMSLPSFKADRRVIMYWTKHTNISPGALLLKTLALWLKLDWFKDLLRACHTMVNSRKNRLENLW